MNSRWSFYALKGRIFLHRFTSVRKQLFINPELFLGLTDEERDKVVKYAIKMEDSVLLRNVLYIVNGAFWNELVIGQVIDSGKEDLINKLANFSAKDFILYATSINDSELFAKMANIVVTRGAEDSEDIEAIRSGLITIPLTNDIIAIASEKEFASVKLEQRIIRSNNWHFVYHYLIKSINRKRFTTEFLKSEPDIDRLEQMLRVLACTYNDLFLSFRGIALNLVQKGEISGEYISVILRVTENEGYDLGFIWSIVLTGDPILIALTMKLLSKEEQDMIIERARTGKDDKALFNLAWATDTKKTKELIKEQLNGDKKINLLCILRSENLKFALDTIFYRSAKEFMGIYEEMLRGDYIGAIYMKNYVFGNNLDYHFTKEDIALLRQAGVKIGEKPLTRGLNK